MENTEVDYKSIPGWRVDADPKDQPNYPIKHYTGADHERSHWERPAQQAPTVEVLHSNERPNLTAVYGTTVPPTGWSGALRRFAFKFSEDSYNHWLPLLLADRVNVYEGIAADIRKGQFPNIFAEKGWKSQWKYDPAGLVQKIVVQGIVIYAVLSFLTPSKKKRARR